MQEAKKRKDISVHIRMSKDDLKVLREVAKSTGGNVSAFVREAAAKVAKEREGSKESNESDG